MSILPIALATTVNFTVQTAVHYRALDAAATPLMKSADGRPMVPP